MSSFELKFANVWAELDAGAFVLPAELKDMLKSALIKNGFETAITVSAEVEKQSEALSKSKETKSFIGDPLARFKIGSDKSQEILIYKTLAGKGIWLTGQTKDHRVVLKQMGGKWTPIMNAWLYPASMQPVLIAHFEKLAGGK